MSSLVIVQVLYWVSFSVVFLSSESGQIFNILVYFVEFRDDLETMNAGGWKESGPLYWFSTRVNLYNGIFQNYQNLGLLLM